MSYLVLGFMYFLNRGTRPDLILQFASKLENHGIVERVVMPGEIIIEQNLIGDNYFQN